MKYDKLAEILEETGLPVAYSHFDDAQELPFITFEEKTNSDLYADGVNYYEVFNYDVVLHFKYKNPMLEKNLKDRLTANNISYAATEDIWIEDEKRYLKTYEVNI